MADKSILNPFNPFDLMDVETKRLLEFFDGLDAKGWTKDTRCEGWRRREIAAHLAAGETYNHACLDDRVKELFEEAARNGATDLNGFNDWTVRIREHKTAEDVVMEWRGANARTREEFRKRGLDGTLPTSVGPYPIDLQAFHLASEYATHADDMGVAVPDSERYQRLGWRLAFSRFAVQEAEKPAEIESRNGKNTVRAAGKEIVLSDEDFVEAVAGRLKTIDDDLQDALRALA